VVNYGLRRLPLMAEQDKQKFEYVLFLVQNSAKVQSSNKSNLCFCFYQSEGSAFWEVCLKYFSGRSKQGWIAVVFFCNKS